MEKRWLYHITLTKLPVRKVLFGGGNHLKPVPSAAPESLRVPKRAKRIACQTKTITASAMGGLAQRGMERFFMEDTVPSLQHRGLSSTGGGKTELNMSSQGRGGVLPCVRKEARSKVRARMEGCEAKKNAHAGLGNLNLRSKRAEKRENTRVQRKRMHPMD